MNTMTEDEISATIVSALAQAKVEESVWRALTYDTGPYGITKPRAAVVQVARAVEAAVLAKAAARLLVLPNVLVTRSQRDD